MTYNNSLDTLRTNLASGNVVAFVGAGMSVGAGLPSWYKMIEDLCHDIGYSLPPPEHTTSMTLIDAAQYFVNKENLHALISFLKDRLDTSDKEPTSAHLALAQLPITTVFTTNYDDLLERAFRKAGKRVNLIVKDESLPFLSRDPNVVNLIKLYGDLDQPDTIVLAREQHDSFFLERPQMIKMLENELTRSDMLYLGWSHSDPQFNLVFGKILTRFKKFLRTGYAVMFDIPENARLEFDRKNIHLVELPSDGNRTFHLTEWLNNLKSSKMNTENINLPQTTKLINDKNFIFISYRRSDSADIAGRIYDSLVVKFGKESIFKDVDSIPLGVDFKEFLERQVGQCNVFITIIGDSWLDAIDGNGNRRLNDPNDFVRIEIESALKRNIPVIPLLVRGARMPRKENLPKSLHKLVYMNGIPIRPDPDFHRDMDRLISGLEKISVSKA